jgi:uncharacterized integral membrane protein (TIGR00697 family)
VLYLKLEWIENRGFIVFMPNNIDGQFKYYSLISMAYITSIIASIIFFNKFIAIATLSTSASLISYSFTYFFGNAVSEIYGFLLARRLIWSAVICGNAFTLYCNMILMIHSPVYQNHDAGLSQVIGGSLRASIAGTIAMLAGSYISVYIISKTKVFFLGQKYWMRTLLASSIGEAINTLIVFPLGMFGTISNTFLFKIITSAYIFKLIFVILQIIPSVIFVHVLKKVENNDYYDKLTNYNPFIF